MNESHDRLELLIRRPTPLVWMAQYLWVSVSLAAVLLGLLLIQVPLVVLGVFSLWIHRKTFVSHSILLVERESDTLALLTVNQLWVKRIHTRLPTRAIRRLSFLRSIEWDKEADAQPLLVLKFDQEEPLRLPVNLEHGRRITQKIVDCVKNPSLRCRIPDAGPH
ncbi:MAG: hypothetical protein U0Z75_09205 [Deinococcaceae bacterium]